MIEKHTLIIVLITEIEILFNSAERKYLLLKTVIKLLSVKLEKYDGGILKISILSLKAIKNNHKIGNRKNINNIKYLINLFICDKI